MKNTCEFLDAIKAKNSLTSDYQLAKLLGCTPSAIGNYRHGKSMLSDEYALKVADLLGLEGGYVLACIAAERSKNERVKKAWAWWADHKSLAAVLAVLAVLPFAPWIDQDSLSGIALLGFTTTGGELCILCQTAITIYWPLLILLATLALLAFPRYRRR